MKNLIKTERRTKNKKKEEPLWMRNEKGRILKWEKGKRRNKEKTTTEKYNNGVILEGRRPDTGKGLNRDNEMFGG